MRMHRVRALLMGGQACVFYGAAEFSRDTDFVILADAANLARLRKVLADLRAEPIAVPPFELKYLRRGHALHFRCQHPEALRMRVDVMSKMRDVDSFAKLAIRRPLLHQVLSGALSQIEKALAEEEQRLRMEDKAYWLPLRNELETLRHAKQTPTMES